MTLLEEIKNGMRLQVSYAEACSALGWSKQKLRRRIDTGQFIPVRPDSVSGRLYFDAGKFLDFYESQPEYSCTAGYVTPEKVLKMENARNAKKQTSLKSASGAAFLKGGK